MGSRWTKIRLRHQYEAANLDRHRAVGDFPGVTREEGNVHHPDLVSGQ